MSGVFVYSGFCCMQRQCHASAVLHPEFDTYDTDSNTCSATPLQRSVSSRLRWILILEKFISYTSRIMVQLFTTLGRTWNGMKQEKYMRKDILPKLQLPRIIFVGNAFIFLMLKIDVIKMPASIISGNRSDLFVTEKQRKCKPLDKSHRAVNIQNIGRLLHTACQTSVWSHRLLHAVAGWWKRMAQRHKFSASDTLLQNRFSIRIDVSSNEETNPVRNQWQNRRTALTDLSSVPLRNYQRDRQIVWHKKARRGSRQNTNQGQSWGCLTMGTWWLSPGSKRIEKWSQWECTT